MRWLWMPVAMLAFMIGPAQFPVEPAAAEPRDAERPRAVRTRWTGGRAVRGPGFYVWEEDAREAAGWALELQQSVSKPR